MKTFDGVPIDVRVAFPPGPAARMARAADHALPRIRRLEALAREHAAVPRIAGYATFSMTTRGFGESCGTPRPARADPAGCAAGYVRLMDTRYEVRDAQELAALLADEGRTPSRRSARSAARTAAASSMSLAALKDRKMLPDGSLRRWQSPGGTPMQIAAATPEIPWTDLAYSLMPNGRTLDYVADAPYVGRTGVLKSSWENALYNNGNARASTPRREEIRMPTLRNWHMHLQHGEPYDDANGNPLPAFADIRDELTTHHSSYYIDHSQPPAPLLISSGFTDDLFPADEAIRYYNRTRTEHPSADISLFFGSFGHQRGQNKADATGARSAAELAWFNYYVRGIGSRAVHGVTTYTQTCPNAAASGGPYTAPTLGRSSPRVRSASTSPRRRRSCRRPGRRQSRRRSTRSPAAAHAPRLRQRPGRHGDVPHRPRADRRLHPDGLAHRGGRHHLARLRLTDRGEAARRGHRHQHPDPGGPRPVAAGDHQHPAARCSSCTRTATGSPTATWRSSSSCRRTRTRSPATATAARPTTRPT